MFCYVWLIDLHDWFDLRVLQSDRILCFLCFFVTVKLQLLTSLVLLTFVRLPVCLFIFKSVCLFDCLSVCCRHGFDLIPIFIDGGKEGNYITGNDVDASNEDEVNYSGRSKTPTKQRIMNRVHVRVGWRWMCGWNRNSSMFANLT